MWRKFKAISDMNILYDVHCVHTACCFRDNDQQNTLNVMNTNAMYFASLDTVSKEQKRAVVEHACVF
jgi:hypothetical protein